MKRKAEVSISVNGYDCSGIKGSGPLGFQATPEQLEAIANTFNFAARCLRARKHGAVECEKNLVSIGIDFGGAYDEEKGLPVIHTVKVRKALR